MINNHHIDKNGLLCTTLILRNHRNTDRYQLALNAVLGQLGDPVHIPYTHAYAMYFLSSFFFENSFPEQNVIHICKPYDYLCI